MAIKPSNPAPNGQAMRCPRKSTVPSAHAASAAKVAPATRAALDQAAAAQCEPARVPDHLSKPIFVGVPEVARRLGLGQTTVWIALIRDGKLPVVRIGRRTLVSVQALEAFAASLQQGV